MFRMDQLPIGDTAYITKLENIGMHRRLLDMGFTPGEAVRCLFEGCAADPRAYLIRHTVIALRNEDARHVLLRKGE